MSETLVIEREVAEGILSVETQVVSLETERQLVVSVSEVADTIVLEANNALVSVTEDMQTYVVAAGSQGPQGVQGIPGPAGAATQILVAGEALGGHRIVVPNASGEAVYADYTISTHANKVIGMTTQAAILGDDVHIQSSGECTDPSWSWVLDTPVWLGTNGLMTQVQPTTGFSQIIGFPLTQTKLVIHLREPIFLN